MKEVAPPATPPHVVPHIPEVPQEPPAENHGRVLFATEGEPAVVARVTNGSAAPLCITPCAADLRIGAHALTFTSLTKSDHTSSDTIAVPRGTVVMRYALGYEKPVSMPYAAGVASALAGTGLTVIGSLGLTAGLVSKGSVDEQGRPIDNSGFVTFGGVLGGVGVAALVTGIVMMVANQPERRPGTTTTFLLPSAPPASHSSWSAR